MRMLAGAVLILGATVLFAGALIANEVFCGLGKTRPPLSEMPGLFAYVGATLLGLAGAAIMTWGTAADDRTGRG